ERKGRGRRQAGGPRRGRLSAGAAANRRATNSAAKSEKASPPEGAAGPGKLPLPLPGSRGAGFRAACRVEGCVVAAHPAERVKDVIGDKRPRGYRDRTPEDGAGLRPPEGTSALPGTAGARADPDTGAGVAPEASLAPEEPAVPVTPPRFA